MGQSKGYQILARRYRPQRFADVVGQDAVVTTLRNAIAQNRLAQAYLFCGPRGTGKTSLARILAKALNCTQREKESEPCGSCRSCQEITSGSSLDVLEIDGASHRGIEDIRQINDTILYAASSGKYKIYLIDEVHMLTKEAFNALLKTLEEPPSHVKFFFATTEPHKVLPTIISRCQRFSLQRISEEKIVEKLQAIARDLALSIDEEALHQIAIRAEGGLRDAESLLDQILSFHEGAITLRVVCDVFGIVPQEQLFALDEAGKKQDWQFAFSFAEQLYREGKDLSFLMDSLLSHFRHLLFVKVSKGDASGLPLSSREKARFAEAAQSYTKEQLTSLLDDLFDLHSRLRTLPTGSLTIEMILLRILRSHHRISYDELLERMRDLEKNIRDDQGARQAQFSQKGPSHFPVEKVNASSEESALERDVLGFPPIRIETGTQQEQLQNKPEQRSPLVKPPDPETGNTYLPKEEKEAAPIDLGARPSAETHEENRKKQVRRDTLLEFASEELGGQLYKNYRKKQ